MKLLDKLFVMVHKYGTLDLKDDFLEFLVTFSFKMASDASQTLATRAFKFLVTASKDPRTCQQFKAENTFFLCLGLPKLINQVHDQGLRDRAA